MAELAAAASVIGISTTAFQGIKSAYDFIDGMKEAPGSVKRIASELEELQGILKSIPTQDDAVPVVQTTAQEMNLKGLIDTCDKACLEFVGKLQQWMPNPNDPSFLDRAKVQAHRKAVRTCRNIVRDTKATITLGQVVAVKRLQVETLRQQVTISDDVAKLLLKEATSQALTVREEAEKTAQLDVERDEEEEHGTAGHDAMELDVACEVSTGGETLGASSVQDFENMVREASRRGIQLSRSVVEQEFGKLEMEDDNEFKRGIEGKGEGEVKQKFGDIKIGSGNKVSEGIYK